MDETEKQKLRILLNYWIEHNKEHGDEFKEWAEKAGDPEEAVVRREILEAVQHMSKVNDFLIRALDNLKS